MTPQEASNFIQSRVSIFPKDFIEGELIERSIIENILENASWAPTHKFTEPWYFKVYSQKGKATLLKKCLEVYTSIFGAEKAVFYEEKLQKKLDKSSHVLLICMKRDPKRSIPEWEEVASVSCAVQNLNLSLKSHNIGGYWSSPRFCPSAEMNASFQLDPEDQCLGFFFLGKVDPNRPEKSNRTRKPLDTFTEWIED